MVTLCVIAGVGNFSFCCINQYIPTCLQIKYPELSRVYIYDGCKKIFSIDLIFVKQAKSQLCGQKQRLPPSQKVEAEWHSMLHWIYPIIQKIQLATDVLYMPKDFPVFDFPNVRHYTHMLQGVNLSDIPT